MLTVLMLELQVYLYHICYLKLNYDPFVDFCLNSDLLARSLVVLLVHKELDNRK